ncbi:CPBP family intramembrane metalloprotease [Dyadobacter sp. CY345]|uniref:CPBP family intramembrane glutamic endopeptidase n=1 Tax=Dyadobacter sp. CY345 TaxID=2909335 RepID=UPI001F1B9C08|nr:CPBP family intramembrane glutamic endopeptidase [Dyadobacter sp. CY345]MCF2444701.1 CPBP family intramembrane metalloprotease [Dyadobacter sp. CY345]
MQTTLSMLKNILTFYRNPYAGFNTGKTESIRERLILLKKAFVFCLCSCIVIVLCIIIVIEEILKSKFNISIIENLHNTWNEFRAWNSPLDTFLKVSIIGPFSEEVLFRLPLITKSTFLRLAIFFGWVDFLFPELFNFKYLSWSYGIVLLIILAGILVSEKISDQNFQTIFQKKSYNYMSWVLMVAFGLVHIYNFTPLNWSFIYLYPFYVLPQFVSGIVFSYLAIRFNSLLWPFLLHASINSASQIHRLVTELF